jgi:putative transposase
MAVRRVIGNAADQESGRWINNRAENSNQPFRRLDGAILRFRDMKTLQKFAAVHASIHNHFNQGRHLYNRVNFKLNGSASMAEWRQLAA